MQRASPASTPLATNITSASSSGNVRVDQRADDEKVALKNKLIETACHLSIATTMLDTHCASESNGNSQPQPSIETVVGRGRDPHAQSCAGLHGAYDEQRGGGGGSGSSEPHVCAASACGGCIGGACDETYEQRERRMAQQTWVQPPDRPTRR